MELRYIVLYDRTKNPYYYLIVDEIDEMYTIKDIFGETVELDKTNISNIITLNPYPVGTTVLSTKNKRTGTITNINEHRYNELYSIDTPQGRFRSTHYHILPIDY